MTANILIFLKSAIFFVIIRKTHHSTLCTLFILCSILLCVYQKLNKLKIAIFLGKNFLLEKKALYLRCEKSIFSG